MGIGAASTAIWFSFNPMKTNVGVKMLAAVVVFGLSILTFGIASHITGALGLTGGTLALGGATVFVHPAFLLSLIALICAGARTWSRSMSASR